MLTAFVFVRLDVYEITEFVARDATDQVTVVTDLCVPWAGRIIMLNRGEKPL